MGAKFIFCFESYEALQFTLFVWAQEMCLGEVNFQACIVFVVNVFKFFICVAAYITIKMIALQMLIKYLVVV